MTISVNQGLLDVALDLAGGLYQYRIVSGKASLAGSDLRGRTAWNALELERAQIVARLRVGGFAEVVRGPRGRVELLVGSADERSRWLAANPTWRLEPSYLAKP